jgi:hypothetical protein
MTNVEFRMTNRAEESAIANHLDLEYRDMACDKVRETEAIDWVEATVADFAD